MAEAKEFFSAAKHALEEVKNTQREPIYQAAKMMGDCMLENGLVQLDWRFPWNWGIVPAG